MSETKALYPEGSPWFWKIFGGAIVGLVSILLLAHLTNINNSIDRTFIDVRGEMRELRQTVDLHKERLTAIEQNGYKLHMEVLEKQCAAIQISTDENRTKQAGSESSLTAMKEEIKTLREQNKELTKQMQDMSKEYGKQIQELREKLLALTPPQPPKKEEEKK